MNHLSWNRIVLVVGMFAGLLVATPAVAKKSLNGRWNGPVGPMKITQTGMQVVGTLTEDSPVCPYKKGEKVLEGSMMAGNLAGKVRLCVTECAKSDDVWAFSMLVTNPERISGAAAVKAPGSCSVPGRSPKGGVMFLRAKKKKPAPPPPKGGESGEGPIGPEQPGRYDPRAAIEKTSMSDREKAMEIARDGAAYLNEGRFERARDRFLEAVKIDKNYAEGFNGIGVTYALRRNFPMSIIWYQRSIAANPDIGDAYYNLACAYAQTKKPEVAIRYLRLAVLNGHSNVDNLKNDADRDPLKERPDFQGVLKLGELMH